jgi:hypothetical protein
MGPTDEPLSDAAASGGPTPTPAPTPTVTPEPTPAPTPAPTPSPSADPTITASVTIPAQENAESEGGEWNLLLEKLRGLIDGDQLKVLWIQLRLPIRLITALILLVVGVQIYSGLIRTINSVPVGSGLLELIGLIWLVRFSLTNLIRRSDRAEVISSLRARWDKVIGR